jgi:hypothetical protein
VAPPPEPPLTWRPSPKALAALSAPAQAFIADARREYRFNFLAGRVLMDAARTMDLLTACQASIAEHGVMLTGPRGRKTVNPMVKEHRRHARWLVQALKALRLAE